MKKLFLFDLLVVGLIVLAGLSWSVHAQSEYADRLDHFGLSETTVQLHTQSTMTPAQATAALVAAKVNDVQVQMQTSGKTPVVYVFAKGDYTSLPLVSGSWFSDADLQSPLPTAVVGQQLEAGLHLGSNQRYLNTAGQFVPILGIVASRQAKALARVTFINAASATAGPALKGLTVLADGDQIDAKLGALKRALKASSTSPYTFTSGTQKLGWWQRNRQILLAACGLLLLAAGCGWLMPKLAPKAATHGLDPAMRQAYWRGWWRLAMVHTTVSVAIGATISWWGFYLTDKLQMVGFDLLLLATYGLVGYLGLAKRFRIKRSE